jgi:hypothetical protein
MPPPPVDVALDEESRARLSPIATARILSSESYFTQMLEYSHHVGLIVPGPEFVQLTAMPNPAKELAD